VEFEPEHFQQIAGLVCYYNSAKFHYLCISHDESTGKHLRVMSCIPDSLQADAFTPLIAIPSGKPVHLRVEIDYERLHFAYRVEGADNDWRWLPQQFDASIQGEGVLRWGAHAPPRAVVGASADHVVSLEETINMAQSTRSFRPARRRPKHARARVLPKADGNRSDALDRGWRGWARISRTLRWLCVHPRNPRDPRFKMASSVYGYLPPRRTSRCGS